LDSKIKAVRAALPEWIETYVVFGDERELDDSWYDTERGFVELSARQQRKKAEISYARGYAKLVRGIEGSFDLKPMAYRYVILEPRTEIECLEKLQI